MRLILHIGTHKTGTSALQKFLHINRELLLEQWVFYASRAGSKNANFMGRELVEGNQSVVQSFFAESLIKAEAAGANTMLVSAESLYAMSAFNLSLKDKPCDKYWELEKQAIESLRASIPQELEIQIVCYFRRPDQFLESIYNQIIKATRYSGSIDEFLNVMMPALDYIGHIQLWQQVFGKEHCSVYGYENAGQNIVSEFLTKVLGIIEFEHYENKELRLNTRLSRDVLEFKRILNRIPASRVQREMDKRSCVVLNNQLGDSGRYHDYLISEKRSQLLQELDLMLASIATQFGVEFAEARIGDAEAYPGLSVEKVAELIARYETTQTGTNFRIGKILLSMARSIRKNRLGLTWVLTLARWLKLNDLVRR